MSTTDPKQSLIKRLAGGVGRFFSSGKRIVVNPRATAEFFRNSRPQQEEFRNPYKQHAWVYSCIDIIASSISRVPFLIKTGKERGNGKTVENHALVDLFENPNPHLTRASWWKVVITLLQNGGESVLVKMLFDGTLAGEGDVPVEMWPIPGNRLDPIVEGKGSMKVKAWMYRSPSGQGTEFYDPENLVFFKHADPENILRGLSPLSAAISAARQDWKAAQFNEAFLDNDASAGGVLITQRNLDDEAKAGILKAWEHRHGGRKKRARVALLEGGMSYTPNQTSHKDMDFIEQRKWSREEVMAVYKVPKFMLAVYEDINFATAHQAIKAFWTETLFPIMTLLEDTLWAHLFEDIEGGKYWGEFDRDSIEPLQEEMAQKLLRATELKSLMYPINVINEHLGLGLPKLPPEIGDVPWIPLGSIPADQILLPPDDPTDPQTPQEPAGDDEGGEGDPEDEEADTKALEAIVDAREVPVESRVKWVAVQVAKLQRTTPKEAKKIQQTVLRTHMIPFETKFRKKTRRYLMELRAEQLRLVENLDTGRARIRPFHRQENVGGVLFDLNEWNDKIKSTHHGVYMDVVEASIDMTFDELGGHFAEFDASDPRALDIITARENHLTSVNTTISQRVSKSIAKGLEAGEDVSQIQARIRQDFNVFSASSSLTIARTEVANATNQSRHETFQSEGVDRHMWVTAGDEAVRTSHLVQNKHVVNVGELFPNGLQFPGDPSGLPGETINCRCITVSK